MTGWLHWNVGRREAGRKAGRKQGAEEGVRDRPGQGQNAGIGNDVMARYDSYD